MAGPIGSSAGGNRRRVFVLVDGGIVRGIFNSWDDAEAYADEKRFSLDHLMEYETRRDFPDHLHLMVAKWDEDWVFQGQWSRQAPNWRTPPRKIRLDHYHFKGNDFELFRQKEFNYAEGIIERINPMAPDSALVAEIITPRQSTPPPVKPELPPLLPRGKEEEPPQSAPAEPESSETEPDDTTPVEPPFEETPHPQHTPEPPAEPERSPGEAGPEEQPPAGHSGEPAKPPEPEEPARKSGDSPPPPVPEVAKPSKLGLGKPPSETSGDKPGVDKPEPVKEPEVPAKKQPPSFPDSDSGEFSELKPQPRISFQKKANPLRLKTKGGPQPIPSFKPTVAPPVAPVGKQSSVELAYAQQEEVEKKTKEAEQKAAKARRVWSLRLIFTVIVMVLCWGGGLFWVLRPKPTATSLMAEVTSLASARMMIFEPSMVFFQLQVDPIHQERWVNSLQLKPIPRGEVIPMPTYHALDTWTRPEGFVRPPYSLTEVDEWLDLRTRKIAYGFSLSWEDGSVLILDLESDMLIGWGYAEHYPEVLN